MNASNEENHNNNNNNNNRKNKNNNNNDDQRKKGKGRQKIKMAKIENETNLQVTFSKRRAGVFKKASELSTLCGAESIVLIFSPGDKPHTFGHPDFDTVSNRFLHANKINIVDETDSAPTTAADQLIAAHSEAAMNQRVHELVSMESNLDQEKRRKKDLDQSKKVNTEQPPTIDDLDRSNLDHVKEAVTGFQMVYGDVSKIEAENAHFNANNDGGNPSWNNHVNHLDVVTNPAWNNNINHDIVASALWNNVNHDVVGGSSSWNNNINHIDLPPNPTWESLVNSVDHAAGNSSWDFTNGAWDQNIVNLNANVNNQPLQGLGFQNSFYEFGGPSMIPTIPNVVPPPYNPYPAPVDDGSNIDTFGFTVQYVPPMGPPVVTDFNYGGVNPTPTSMVPYDQIGQGSNQPANTDPNALPPQDPQDPNGGRFRRNFRRQS